MKRNILVLLLVLFFQAIYAQQTFYPESKISHVTIYEQGAMITRSIDTRSIGTDGTIIIDSLPQQLTLKSINVKCGSGLKILSIKNHMEIEAVENDDKKDSIQYMLELTYDSIDYQSTLLKSIKKEIEVIHKNDNFSNEHGTNMEQLAKASDLYKTRLRALNLEQLELSKHKEKFIKIKNELKTQLDALRPKKFQNNSVHIKVEYLSNEDKTMTLSYFTPNARWYTFYDLRVTESDEDSYLDHKAYVVQSTGEDWENVLLTLSNRNPNKKITPSPITPYVLQNVKHMSYGHKTHKDDFRSGNSTTIRGIITDTNGDPLIGANVICKGTSNGTITDIDGNFEIIKPQSGTLIISYTGYQTREVNVQGISYCGITLRDRSVLDEVVVTGAKLGYSISADLPSKRKEVERKSIQVKAQKSLNIHSFDISRPYSIPSNGEEHDVLLNSNQIPFIYQHITYPSQEPLAYLKVGIPQWTQYDLFSGSVNLFLEGQYTGVSQLNIESKKDTLWFSLGEDIGINVEKEKVKEFNKKSFLKNKTIELHTFDIIVRNNKNKEVKIDIMDQIPVSADQDIKIKVIEISKAQHDENLGYLTWKEKLASREKKRFRVSYEIKYGKNIDIVSR